MKRLLVSLWLFAVLVSGSQLFVGPTTSDEPRARSAGGVGEERLKASLRASLLPVVPVKIELRPCPFYLPERVDCYETQERVVYLVTTKERAVVYHELGHAFDYFYLTDHQRQVFKALMGFGPSRPWAWEGPPNAGPMFVGQHGASKRARVPPEERFADLYATCSWGRIFYGYGHELVHTRRWSGCWMIRLVWSEVAR